MFIVAPANASVLASANPRFGRFDLAKPLPEQITLPSTILNRFDLIFFINDNVKSFNEEYEFAMKVLNKNTVINDELLKKYVAYAKSFSPILTDEAKETIANEYAKIRTKKADQKIPINARNLEGIVRLAEAHAKLRLSNTVNRKDVMVAFELLNEFLGTIGFDIDTLTVPSDLRNDANKLLEIINSYGYLEYRKLQELAEIEGIKSIDEAIKLLIDSGEVVERGNGIARKEGIMQ